MIKYYLNYWNPNSKISFSLVFSHIYRTFSSIKKDLLWYTWTFLRLIDFLYTKGLNTFFYHLWSICNHSYILTKNYTNCRLFLKKQNSCCNFHLWADRQVRRLNMSIIQFSQTFNTIYQYETAKPIRQLTDNTEGNVTIIIGYGVFSR